MDQPKVAVIVVNYNGTEDSIECLKSLGQITYQNFEVIMVDNCSQDVEKLQNFCEALGGTHFIRLNENNGFAAGNNAGVRYARQSVKDVEYILMLNNDTVVEPDFLEPLVEEFGQHKDLGGCCSHINYFDHGDTWYAGGHMNWRTGTSVHYTHRRENPPPLSWETDFLTGCCLLFPVNIMDNIGYLSEDYFLYFEDTEFSQRLKKAGYKQRYVPRSLIYHKVSATTGYRSPLSNYYGTRNKMMFMSKFASRPDYTVFLLYFSVKVALKRFYYRLKGRRFKPIRDAVREGYYDFFRKVDGKRKLPF